MQHKYISKLIPILLGTTILLVAGLPAMADSSAELLEQGIYTEETVGDLAAAIEIYQQVVETADRKRPHVAQALLRLGLCHTKSGNETEARSTFERLIQDYPKQERLVAEARERLSAMKSDLHLEPVPWTDGESLGYRMSLPTGKMVGTMQLLAEAVTVEGVDAWMLELRRFVYLQADNYGVSHAWIDRETQRPIRSSIRHGILGHADATYGPDGAEVSSGDTVTQVSSTYELYDNDQALHLIRSLPLAPGYKTRVAVLPIWTGQVLETGLEVKGIERCKVPAGEFECFEVVLDIDQTYWVSTGPERYPLKVEGEGLMIELAAIGRSNSWSSRSFGIEEMEFSGALPPGWMPYVQRSPGRSDRAAVRLLDPRAGSISSLEVDRCPRKGCPPLDEMVEKELAGARKRFDHYELREESWSELTIAGQPAIGFVGDFERDGEPWVQYRLYTLANNTRFELIFRTPAETFDEFREEFDFIVESLEAGPETR